MADSRKIQLDVIYLVGGLGVDKRVFKNFKLESPTTVIEWIQPLEKETLSTYAFRLSSQIDENKKFAILGVSFGGIVALELSKYVTPEKVIIISSVFSHSQLPPIPFKLIKHGMLNFLPDLLLRMPNFFTRWMFSASNTEILDQIVRETEPSFVKWALTEMSMWDGVNHMLDVVRIHGAKDRLIPLVGDALLIKGAGHFMIIDNRQEIESVINNLL